MNEKCIINSLNLAKRELKQHQSIDKTHKMTFDEIFNKIQAGEISKEEAQQHFS